jgi:hypothetical protein
LNGLKNSPKQEKPDADSYYFHYRHRLRRRLSFLLEQGDGTTIAFALRSICKIVGAT